MLPIVGRPVQAPYELFYQRSVGGGIIPFAFLASAEDMGRALPTSIAWPTTNVPEGPWVLLNSRFRLLGVACRRDERPVRIARTRIPGEGPNLVDLMGRLSIALDQRAGRIVAGQHDLAFKRDGDFRHLSL